MNVITKFELGEMVSPIINPSQQMQITKIVLFLDGGFQYECSWWEDGIKASTFFERELEDKE